MFFGNNNFICKSYIITFVVWKIGVLTMVEPGLKAGQKAIRQTKQL